MAIFKILGFEPAQVSVEMRVELRSGELVAGDTFRCYETHHPIDYTIQEIQGKPPVLRLQCSGYPCYSGAFVGAVIDTAKAGKLAGFHYEHNSSP